MLKHLEFFLSGAFTYAPREGVLSGANPMRGDSIPHGCEPRGTYAYTLEKITRMLGVLPGLARVVVGCRRLQWPA
jgi:hypothetical protein